MDYPLSDNDVSRGPSRRTRGGTLTPPWRPGSGGVTRSGPRLTGWPRASLISSDGSTPSSREMRESPIPAVLIPVVQPARCSSTGPSSSSSTRSPQPSQRPRPGLSRTRRVAISPHGAAPCLVSLGPTSATGSCAISSISASPANRQESSGHSPGTWRHSGTIA